MLYKIISALTLIASLLSFSTLEAGKTDHVRTYQEKDLHSLFHDVALTFAQTIKKNPRAVIYLSIGSGAEKLYAQIVAKFKEDTLLDLSQVLLFNMTDYVGLSDEHPLSHVYFSRKLLIEPLQKIDASRAPNPKNLHSPTTSLDQFKDEIIKAGSPDLVILEIGDAYPETVKKKAILRGGAVAFNEPGSQKDESVHIVTLGEHVRKESGVSFSSLKNILKTGEIKAPKEEAFQTDVPTQAITMGLSDILKARKIIALGLGENRAGVLHAAFQRTENPDFPATYLISHSNIEWYADENAAPELNKTLDSSTTPILTQNMGVDLLPKNQTVLIVSPHPDDDVISMGATLAHLIERENKVHVVYVVHGANGVRPKGSLFSKHLKDVKAEKSLEDSNQREIEAKIRVRKEETKNATRIVKISAENLHFFQADYYYRRGIPGVSALSKNDIKRMEDYLLEIKPSVIFFAAENDPHGAHGLSTELIVKALQGEKATAWHQQNQLKFMGYRGAYNEWSLNHPEDLLIIPFDQAQMNLKEKAIKEHISQLDPVFPSFDPDPFYIRARKRNRDVMVQLKEIGMVKKDSSLHYAEVFRIFGDEFLKIYG